MNRGLPGRGVTVRLCEKWDQANQMWVPALSWDEAVRVARVTSRKVISGALDADGKSRAAFNVRRQARGPGSTLRYSPTRLFLDQEGGTWRWQT